MKKLLLLFAFIYLAPLAKAQVSFCPPGGEQVMTRELSPGGQLDVGGLNAGIYVLQVMDNKGNPVVVNRFVKD